MENKIFCEILKKSKYLQKKSKKIQGYKKNPRYKYKFSTSPTKMFTIFFQCPWRNVVKYCVSVGYLKTFLLPFTKVLGQIDQMQKKFWQHNYERDFLILAKK